jgi:hypothetical protein
MRDIVFKLPDTGQIKCYDKNSLEMDRPVKGDELFGQNGCFEVNPMSFSKLGDAGKELNDSAKWETGLRMVVDKNTGLIWEIKSPNEKDCNYFENTYTWSEAQNEYIQKLNNTKYGGFNDWRAPHKEELRSIIDYSRANPSVDTWYFPYTKTGMYWCKEIYQMQPYFGWVLFFGVGSATAASLSSKRYVRAVRGGYNKLFGERAIEKFTDNNDGTITDKITGLMWQKGENPRMNWFDALKYSQNFELAEYKDWRMPNIKELNTILDLSYKDGWWYYKEFFPAEGLKPPLLHYFSSSVYEKYFAWVTNFCFGYDGYYANKNSTLLFRLVRNIKVPEATNKIFRLPDSGQKLCYDNIGNAISAPVKGEKFFGQDGNYCIHPISFTKLRDCAIPVGEKTGWTEGLRMVRDNNTGLIWEIKSPEKADVNFKEFKCNWHETEDYINRLNKSEFGGFSDWRLPNKEELRSIVDYNDLTPAVDQHFFPTLMADFYWSKETYLADEKLAWGIYFGYGCGICYLKESQFYVMAVRGGYNRSFGESTAYNFIDNNDGTITDLNTNLMWKKDECPDLGFEDALKYCEDLNLAGHNDWRMPNLKEIATLLDLSFKEGTWFHKKYFPDVKTAPLGFYWSSATFAATFGWGLNFQFGYDGYYADKINGKYPFKPVRNK